jgi:hypothetical protein
MTEPIDTSKNSRDLTPAEREAFIAQCKKLESAPQSKPTDTRSAKDMTDCAPAQCLCPLLKKGR